MLNTRTPNIYTTVLITENDLTKAQSQNTSLSTQLANLQPQLTSLTTKLSTITQQLESESKIRISAEMMADESESKLRETEGTLTSIRAENEELCEQIAFLQDDAEDAKHELNVTREEMEEVKGDVDVLKTRLQEKEELESEVEDLEQLKKKAQALIEQSKEDYDNIVDATPEKISSTSASPAMNEPVTTYRNAVEELGEEKDDMSSGGSTVDFSVTSKDVDADMMKLIKNENEQEVVDTGPSYPVLVMESTTVIRDESPSPPPPDTEPEAPPKIKMVTKAPLSAKPREGDNIDDEEDASNSSQWSDDSRLQGEIESQQMKFLKEALREVTDQLVEADKQFTKIQAELIETEKANDTLIQKIINGEEVKKDELSPRKHSADENRAAFLANLDKVMTSHASPQRKSVASPVASPVVPRSTPSKKNEEADKISELEATIKQLREENATLKKEGKQHKHENKEQAHKITNLQSSVDFLLEETSEKIKMLEEEQSQKISKLQATIASLQEEKTGGGGAQKEEAKKHVSFGNNTPSSASTTDKLSKLELTVGEQTTQLSHLEAANKKLKKENAVLKEEVKHGASSNKAASNQSGDDCGCVIS